MPELPEVETICRQLSPQLVGQQINDMRIYQPRLRWPINPKLTSQVRGHTITAVTRRAKYLLIETSGPQLLIHLGMSGHLRICPQDEPLKKHDHVEWRLKNWTLRFHDPRRFGCIMEVVDATQHPLLAHLGPEPLEAEFNGRYLKQQLATCRRPIKTALMDARIVVGVGNIYANEALFYAGIHPHRMAASLDESALARLVKSIKKILRQALTAGGTTLRDYVNAKGEPGYFQLTLSVYGRDQQACKHCNHSLQSSRLGQRQTVFCPHCQL